VTGIAVGSAVAWWIQSAEKNAKKRDARALRARLKVGVSRSPLIEELAPQPEQVDDELVLELVRSELQRCCSFPDVITVSCAEGSVHLEGPILKAELNRVLRGVARIPGVEEIHDHLEAHRHAWAFSRETAAANGGSRYSAEAPV
jgi:osmotically-inducible protein OsmY